jgi:DNA-binding transcriptional regulator LsrR (DeoR family)
VKGLREKIKESGLKQWEIAEKLGMSEFTFSRKMRRPEQLDSLIISEINKILKEARKED